MTKPPSVYETWTTASVLLPDQRQLHRVRIYATSVGLLIWRPGSVEPDWSSPIDFSATAKPPRGVFHVGIDIVTTAGTVVITPTGGGPCCGSAAKAPTGYDTVAPWPGA